MIKIEKDLNKIPDSIQLPDSKNFVGNVPRSSKTTHERRMEVIIDRKYHDNTKYNSRYKQTDTKKQLSCIYNGKCAFCENKMIQSHVEHYRPKDIYYWLAYSWDNLLLACSSCNLSKGKKFEILGTSYRFENNIENINNIHNNSANIDLIENPKMVNPEVLDPTDKIEFEMNGFIKSKDIRFDYTIKELKIDQKPLNDERRAILDKLRRYIKSALYQNTSIEDQSIALKTIVNNFKIDAKDEKSTFLAFRRYAIKNGWLSEIIKTEIGYK